MPTKAKASLPPAQPKLASATLEHLRASGLTDATIAAASIHDANHPLTARLLEAHGIAPGDGFAIPYVDLDGKRLKHYRVRNLAASNGSPKYLQPKASGNHVYIPHALLPKGWHKDTDQPLYITEGEKKALKAAQEGLLCLALGGVYSWRTYSFKLPRDAVRVEDGPSSKLVHLNAKEARLIAEEVVPELLEISWRGRSVVLIFDSDVESNLEVAQAAFDFAAWMEDRGAAVRQVFVPSDERSPDRKRGLDDWLVADPDAAELLADEDWLRENASSPLPPHPRAWIAGQLNAKSTSRSVASRVAGVALAQLDQWGRRFRDAAENYYYFDNDTTILHEFRLDGLQQLRNTSFGRLVIDELGLNTADQGTMSRFADYFVQREPIETIQPRRVVATSGDQLYYQVSDGRLARISKDAIEIVDNGTDGMLFLPGLVEPLDEDALVDQLEIGEAPHRWRDALATVNLQPLGGMDIEESRALLECLFYLSPWLNRWRRFMPPLEVAVAEPNSGKTFIYNLRKGVLTGRPDLEGLPNDYRGWVSSVSNAPAMWVCDNLGNVKSDFWHQLNDELARLITDPAPTIELRQLYTTSKVVHIPIETTFAVTTIKNPFTAPDVLQRSLVYQLKAIPIGKRDAGWYERQLADRSAWVAEHLAVIQAFFEQVDKAWDPHYLSGYRLINFEQAVLKMGAVLGYDMAGTIAKLPGMVTASVADYDPIIEALVAFSKEWPEDRVKLQDVIEWVKWDEEDRFSGIKVFGNSMLLGRYIASHEYDVEQATGFRSVERNRQRWLIKGGLEDGD